MFHAERGNDKIGDMPGKKLEGMPPSGRCTLCIPHVQRACRLMVLDLELFQLPMQWRGHFRKLRGRDDAVAVQLFQICDFSLDDAPRFTPRLAPGLAPRLANVDIMLFDGGCDKGHVELLFDLFSGRGAWERS